MPAPLSSLKILDFSTLLPGPFSSKTLADLGAEVLRVESPTRPDLVRMLPIQVKNGLTSTRSNTRYFNSQKGERVGIFILFIYSLTTYSLITGPNQALPSPPLE